ncbi:lactonase family protein [Kineosporia sp. J2-2]|uniref:Lactonase family protein n=1 Tax=Kineosporia corallincola TaxID=2835133 RepID=A0ABS5TPL1_9ACTN|nr:lactonase family protein [Kineosporia corallincola]MBT0771988.1 lactonase family protein [Kineosporia corallincola]
MSDARSPFPPGQHHDLFLGTYTERLPHVDGQAPGIMRAGYAGHGKLGETTLATVFRNPSWVAAFEGVLYAVSETRADGGEGDVSAYRIDPDSHTLVLLGMQPSGGADPAHLAVSPDGRYLAVANYSGGSVALFALDGQTGRIGERLDVVVHEPRHDGAGPDPARQEAPHPHMVAWDPHTHDLYVPDLGLDAVLVYRVTDGRLAPAGRIACAPGSGPRHLAFHPAGDVLFLVGELSTTLTVLGRARSGFAELASVPLLPAPSGDASTGTTGDGGRPSTGAAVRVSSGGDLVFASVRGHDSVSVFRYGTDGALQPLTVVPSHGLTPRDIALTPDERHLLVANQDSHSVTVFSVDGSAPGDNVLSYLGEHWAPSPVCLAWA